MIVFPKTLHFFQKYLCPIFPQISGTYSDLPPGGGGSASLAFKCNLCPSYFGSSPAEMEAHSAVLHSDHLYPITCDYCGRQFKNKKLKVRRSHAFPHCI